MPENKPLKVLMLVTRLNIGGPAVQVITLAGNLPDDLFRTTLACGHLASGEGDMRYLAADMGVAPVYIPGLGREISPLDDAKALFAIVGLIAKLRPDIVHTHTAKAGTIGRIAVLIANAGRIAGKKITIVHTFHGHTFHSYFGKIKTTLFKCIEKTLSGFTDRIIAISPSQKEDICDRYRVAANRKVTVIPLGFDLSRFNKAGEREKDPKPARFPGFSPDRFVSGIVGRLTRVKHPRMLLDVAKIIKDLGKENDFGFVFVGDGELKAELMTLTRKRGLEKMVIFTGWQKDTAAIYTALDAVLLTSLNEGTPVSLIEAMASETPVIAADVGGVRDLMGKQLAVSPDRYRVMGNGILVDPRDAEAMALALIQVRGHRERFEKRAKRAARAVMARYATKRVIEETSTLYRSLGNRR